MKISERIRYVGVNDCAKELFENQWPLPWGVSYNSYLVIGDKVALIDTAAAGFGDEFLDNIRMEIGERHIDYLVVNHMEPDHSALMARIRQAYPAIEILTSAKAVPMIAGYQGITDGIRVVREGETLDLGGATLQFFMTPMVHWPETMMTFLQEEKTLFSGDAFGCFKAVGNAVNERFADFEDEMVRYYSNIVGKYGQTVQAALKKLAGLTLERICPTHGPVWSGEEMGQVVALYDKLSRYEGIPGVCIVYGSMYGNTAQAAETLAAELEKRGIPHVMHNLTQEHVSFAYRDLFRYDTLVVGAPTYNNDIFPPVRDFMHGVGARLVKNRRFAAFGSYTWMGASVKLLNEMAEACKFTLVSEGLSFPQGYSPEKCDMAGLADKLAE